MREWVNAQVSGYRVDDGQNDVIMLSLYGPRGGKRALEVLTRDQARMLASNLFVALMKFGNPPAQEDRHGSISHMPDRNSDDAVDENGCPTW